MEKLNQGVSTTENVEKKGFLATVKDKVNEKSTALFVSGVVGLGASNSAFALDATEIVNEINALDDPLTKIGVATIGVVLIGFGIAKAKGMIK